MNPLEPRQLGRLVGKLRQPADGSGAQRRGVAGDGGFSGVCGAWQAPIQRGDQFLEFPGEIHSAYRHDWRPLGVASRREAFQTSPQAAHRQYALSSGVRAVVEIATERQDGHRVGSATVVSGETAGAERLRKSNESTAPPEHVGALSVRINA